MNKKGDVVVKPNGKLRVEKKTLEKAHSRERFCFYIFENGAKTSKVSNTSENLFEIVQHCVLDT